MNLLITFIIFSLLGFVGFSQNLTLTAVTPASNGLSGEQLNITATVQSDYEIQSLIGIVEGRQTSLVFSKNAYNTKYGSNPGWTNILNLSGLTHGTKTLVLIATDTSGLTKTLQVPFRLDAPPKITVSSPNQHSIARPTIQINASAEDDSDGTKLSVKVAQEVVFSSDTAEINQLINLSKYEGQQINLILTATDSAAQTTSESIILYIESSPRLVTADTVGGEIWDITTQKILFKQSINNQNKLLIRDRSTGTDSIIFNESGASPQYGFLTDKGSIFIDQSGNVLTARVIEVIGKNYSDYGQPNSASSLKVNGNYAIWNQGTKLFLRDTTGGTTKTISETAGNWMNSVGPNGAVAYWTSDYKVKFNKGGFDSVVSSPSLWNTYTITDGTSVLYRKHDPCCNNQRYGIYLFNGIQEVELAPLEAGYEPNPVTDYDARAGWIAFTRSGTSGQRQVWLRSPSGIENQITFFGDSSRIEAVGADGSAILKRSRRYYSKIDSTPLDVSSTLGRTFWVSDSWMVAIGGSVFRINTDPKSNQLVTFKTIGDQVLGSPALTLEASSNSGLPIIFSVVSGPASITGNKLTILGEGSITIKATQPGNALYLPAEITQTFFVRSLSSLTISSSPSAGGAVSVSPTKNLYSSTDSVTLIATATNGFRFDGWSGDASGTQPQINLLMDSDKSVTALFKDITNPTIEWNYPVSTDTTNETIIFTGKVTDNHILASAFWTHNQANPNKLNLDSVGFFTTPIIPLNIGINRFSISAVDSFGNIATVEKTITLDSTSPLPTSQATAIAKTVNGFVVEISVLEGGYGYTANPIVTVSGNGSGAAAVATISQGKVIDIRVTSAGSGYTGAVTVSVEPPPQSLEMAIRLVPEIKVTGKPGTVAQIEWSSSLEFGGVWQAITNVTIGTNGFSFVDLAPASTARLYRTVQALAPTNPTGFVWIAPNTFSMGSLISEEGRDFDEVLHTVVISRGFWICDHEVTQEEFQSVLGFNPSKVREASYPVESVNWDDAVEYCRRLTEREQATGNLMQGYRYRLPTEAEWEYACRAGSTTPIYGILSDVAWYEGNSSGKIHSIKSKQPNAWGIYDMHGNVWEWCSDWYGDYPSSGVQADPVGPASGTERVFRGGSWYNPYAQCRSASRSSRPPGSRFDNLGFRPVLAPQP